MSKSRIRYPVKGVTEAPQNGALRIRTRLHCSEQDLKVVEAMGGYFDRLCGEDLAMRCRPITDEMRAISALVGFVRLLTGRYSAVTPSAETMLWAIRKQHLTAKCSSRYAGWITKSSNDSYNLAVRNQQRALAEKNKAIEVISKPRSTAQHRFERAPGGVGDRLRRSSRFSRGSSLKGALGQGSWRSSLMSACGWSSAATPVRWRPFRWEQRRRHAGRRAPG